jgi:hypothetical protein
MLVLVSEKYSLIYEEAKTANRERFFEILCCNPIRSPRTFAVSGTFPGCLRKKCLIAVIVRSVRLGQRRYTPCAVH